MHNQRRTTAPNPSFEVTTRRPQRRVVARSGEFRTLRRCAACGSARSRGVAASRVPAVSPPRPASRPRPAARPTVDSRVRVPRGRSSARVPTAGSRRRECRPASSSIGGASCSSTARRRPTGRELAKISSCSRRRSSTHASAINVATPSNTRPLINAPTSAAVDIVCMLTPASDGVQGREAFDRRLAIAEFQRMRAEFPRPPRVGPLKSSAPPSKIGEAIRVRGAQARRERSPSVHRGAEAASRR